MKCDLCKGKTKGDSLLCEPCSEMIERLLTIRGQLEEMKVSVPETQATAGNAAQASR